MPTLVDASAVIVLPDPYTFDTDALLRALGQVGPGVPVLGGLAGARTIDGTAALFKDGEVVEEGVVGAIFEGVAVHACVSQGAAPIGPELTVTRAEGLRDPRAGRQAGAGQAAGGL